MVDKKQAKITVFGSFVVDLMGRTPHLPVPGETVKGSLFKMGPGGKGFNQAVAAHKAGANVTVVTKIGQDTFGEVAKKAMEELSMDTSHLIVTDQTETGCALIMVDETVSQNEIVVIPGACETISDEEIDSLSELMENSDYLLIQLETNRSAIERMINLAHQKNVKIILNTAPIQAFDLQLLDKVDIITPNEVEAELLSGIKIDDLESANQAADWFFAKGVGTVIITLGGRGVYVATADERSIIPAYKVDALDTTGAGDAFNGGLVAKLAEGDDVWQATRFANALAALSVQKMGTTVAMPTRQEIDAFIKEQATK